MAKKSDPKTPDGGQGAKTGGVGRLVKIAILTVLILLGLSVAAGVGAYHYIAYEFTKPGPAQAHPAAQTAAETGEPVNTFTLPKGYGLRQTAAALHDQGYVSNPFIFRLGVLANDLEQDLKAGEYAIPDRASMRTIMDILVEGKAILYKLTVPEGLTTAQILALVRDDDMLTGDLTVRPVEGDLLPETYLFQRGMARDDLIAQMEAAHDRVVDKLWKNRADDLPFTSKEQAVILASIVEKETGLAQERPRVAAVFINRLKRGMKLESDPTIIYGLTKGEPLGRGLRRSELDKETPYNTYQIVGLPPTPIANPGRAALAAVLNPPDTKDLYFVADGTGGHAFASTYREHQRNVAAWRRKEREQKAGTN